MSKQYVEEINGFYRIANTRVSLDSLVYGFLQGQSPETIAQSFPVLTLEEVYGALAFYLANRVEIDRYLARTRQDFEILRNTIREKDPTFYKKLAAARRAAA